MCMVGGGSRCHALAVYVEANQMYGHCCSVWFFCVPYVSCVFQVLDSCLASISVFMHKGFSPLFLTRRRLRCFVPYTPRSHCKQCLSLLMGEAMPVLSILIIPWIVCQGVARTPRMKYTWAIEHVWLLLLLLRLYDCHMNATLSMRCRFVVLVTDCQYC